MELPLRQEFLKCTPPNPHERDGRKIRLTATAAARITSGSATPPHFRILGWDLVIYTAGLIYVIALKYIPQEMSPTAA